MGADIEEVWQQVRDGAVALQKEVSLAVVLQRRIYAEQMQLLDGRYEALRLDNQSVNNPDNFCGT